jgi:cytochrome c oxidase cbb3-type subunit 3
MKRILTIITILLTIAPVMAEDDGLIPAPLMEKIGWGAVFLMLVLVVVALLVTLRALRILLRAVLRADGLHEDEINAQVNPQKTATAKEKESVWLKVLSLKPMSQEKDLIIQHEYDGIQELDNPTPAWFMWLFYTSIAFGIGYLLIYHVFDAAPLQDEEYKIEMAVAEKAKETYLSKSANRVDENTVKLVTDAATLKSGQTVYTTSCAPCHGQNGQGVVGPNLTDEYWLHGSKISDLFKTIKYGVLAKGMPTWEKQLSPKQIADVSNYVKSLQGTKPAGAKEPQGEKE